MQAPKRKTSKSKRNMRRAHDAICPLASIKCSNCGEVVLPHTICHSCGQYRGRQLLPARN